MYFDTIGLTRKGVNEMDLKYLGLSEVPPEAAENCAVVGRVAAQYRDRYKVLTETGAVMAVVAGRLRHTALRPADFPAVGDFVLLDHGADDPALIGKVLPRHSALIRRAAGTAGQEQMIAANLDTVFICMALNSDYNPRRLERYLSLVWDSGALPVVVLTKSDLCDDLPARLVEISHSTCGAAVLPVSSLEKDSAAALKEYLEPGRTVAFIGSSGVGKSTLINRLLESDELVSGDLRRDGKGRHTTTRREMFILPGGGIVIDTPGMRELALEGADMASAFADITELSADCRFSNCSHEQEPDCAVLQAVADGRLSAARLNSWRKLRQESRYAGMNSRQIEEEKLSVMFADVGGRKNARRLMKNANKKRKF